MDREAWRATVHGFTESDTAKDLPGGTVGKNPPANAAGQLNLWDTAIEPACSKPHAPQQERPLQREAHARVAPAHCNLGKSVQSNEDPAQPKTNKYYSPRTLKIHWKDWCWSWNSNTLASWCKELTHWKRPWYREWLRAGGEGVAEDEVVRWRHQLNGNELEQTLGDSGG